MKYTIKSVSPGALSFAPASKVDEILQNILVILNTPKGSVPCYREFGIDMGFVHMPLPLAKTMYVAAASDAIEQFEPRARLNSITFDTDANDPSAMLPVLEVTISE